MTELPPMNQPPFHQMFGLEWEYNPDAPRFHRFGVSDGCRGVGNYADPLSAYLALRRWRKASPIDPTEEQA